MFLKFGIDFKNKKCYSYTLNQHKGKQMQEFQLMYSVETEEYELLDHYVKDFFTDVEFQKRLHAGDVREIHFLDENERVITSILQRLYSTNRGFISHAESLAIELFH